MVRVDVEDNMKDTKKGLVIAIDFDGTCVTHEFPRIGRDIGAEPVLKRLVDAGHRLILWTMRSDVEAPLSSDPAIHAVGGQYLTDAVKWFIDRDIPLWGINANPEQHTWTHSPKAYAQLYIDDAALGIELVHDMRGNDRPYVDWEKTELRLEYAGILPPKPAKRGE